MKPIGFLGFGNMATAIANGLLDGGLTEDTKVFAYDPYPEKIRMLGEGVYVSSSALQLIDEAKIIFLCVKPQDVDPVLDEIKTGLTPDHILVSIAAGVDVAQIRARTGAICPVVRAMPNTPMLLGTGTVAIARPVNIADADYRDIVRVFECVGAVFEISPDKFNEVIPVNGSSPAFIYLFAKVMAERAAAAGLDYQQALEMFAGTLIGSARMILDSGYDVDTLISMVSSKGGTTVAALEAMHENGFEAAIIKGFDRCVERAYELGE